jgi:hypothetical protein
MSDHHDGQTQPLTGSGVNQNNYGTVPAAIGSLGTNTDTSGRRFPRGRRGIATSPTGSGFPRTNTRGSQYEPHEHSPLAMRRPISVSGLKDTIKEQWRNTLKRTPSTYDPPLDDVRGDVDDTEATRVNGIRVWYSSFTSIDWLHDAVRRNLLPNRDTMYQQRHFRSKTRGGGSTFVVVNPFEAALRTCGTAQRDGSL